MRIAAEALAAIQAHARDADPHECCGLLVGTSESIQSSVPARNRAADPERRYEIDPHDLFAAIRHARERRLDVVGAYHSHPRSAPVPSDTDRVEAFEDFIFVIAGRERSADRPPDSALRFAVRAWRWTRGNFAELALVCDS